MFADGTVGFSRRPAFPLRQQHQFRRARGQVPDTRGPVSADRREPVAAHVKTHRGNPVHMAAPSAGLGPVARLTESDYTVGAAEGKGTVGRAEDENPGAAFPPAQRQQVLAGVGIPDPDSAVGSRGGQLPGQRAEGHRMHDPLVPDQDVTQNGLCRIPDQYGSVRPGGREMTPGAVICECPGTVRALRQRIVGLPVLGLPYPHDIARGCHTGSVRAERHGRRGFGALVSPYFVQGGGPIGDTVDGQAAILPAYRRQPPARCAGHGADAVAQVVGGPQGLPRRVPDVQDAIGAADNERSCGRAESDTV
jgi:hypothetical protein